jgi:23S rRNA pseudouridine1911/1915/1917 synthase
MAIVTHHGKPATTHYHTIDTFHNVCARVECRLETGRTHQIRVHMTSLGHGLIGDPVYGKNRISRTGQNLKGKKSYKDLPEDVKHALEIFNRQALHAKILGFEHPKIGKNLRFESIYPSDFNTLLQLLQKEH